MRTTILAAALAALATNAASAQTALPRDGRSGFAFEWLNAFADEDGLKFPSGAAFISGHFTIGTRSLVLAELPIGRSQTDFGTSSAVGNPYVGLRFLPSAVAVDVGVRLPVGSEQEPALLLGFLTDIEHYEAFITEATTLQLEVSSRRSRPAGFSVDLFGGLSIASTDGDNLELGKYGLQASYLDDALRFRSRLAGRLFLDCDQCSLGERTIHQISAAADFGRGQVRPGVNLIVPLEDDSELLKFSLGLYVAVILR